MVEITKEFTFDCAHHLKNYRGLCANLHGHTYKLQVTIAGEPNEQGFVMDFGTMKEIVTRTVIEPLDHRYLNDICDFNPTAEFLSIWIFKRLKINFSPLGVSLVSVKLWETPTSFVEYRG